ncbi:MAG: hypothetical protein ABR567_10300 [Myxococcales bacterium]|nr:hypothetical protein [Myxococcales bacterium]
MKLALLILVASAPALAQVRVEPRSFVKERHFFFSGGLTWLDRNDYYVSPGGAFSAVYYFRESDGVELRTAFFWSHLDGSAQEVVSQAGLYPDAQKPQVLLLVGWRHSLTYGKVALFSTVVHFDVQSGVHAGTLMTDRAATPALAGSFGVVAGIGRRAFAQLDLALLGSMESRSERVLALGLLPLLTFGWSL